MGSLEVKDYISICKLFFSVMTTSEWSSDFRASMLMHDFEEMEAKVMRDEMRSVQDLH